MPELPSMPGLFEWVAMPTHEDGRGVLSYVESSVHVPFGIERVYYIYDAPSDAVRGEHAHRELHQVLIAVRGECYLSLDNGQGDRAIIPLRSPRRGVYLPPMTWREMMAFDDCVLLVLASEPHDPGDYIDDYEQFRKETNEDD